MVEVDFRDRRSDGDEHDLLVKARERLLKSHNVLVKVQNEMQVAFDQARWLKRQCEWERARRRKLELELRAERARGFPFIDQHVLDALVSVYDGDPVSASAVAGALYPAGFSHSARIRVGLALSRLATDAKVSAIPAAKPGLPMRWRPLNDA